MTDFLDDVQIDGKVTANQVEIRDSEGAKPVSTKEYVDEGLKRVDDTLQTKADKADLDRYYTAEQVDANIGEVQSTIDEAVQSIGTERTEREAADASMNQILETKVNQSALDTHVEEYLTTIDRITQAIETEKDDRAQEDALLSAGISAAQDETRQKADQTYVDESLAEFQRKLDEKASKEDLSKIYRPCGSVQNYSDLLAIQNPQIGDVYDVTTTGMNYAYVLINGEPTWDALGAIGDNIDLSNYYTKGEIDAKVQPLENDKVSKSGDTMTGNLSITKNIPQFLLNNTNLALADRLTTDTNIATLTFNDKNNKYVGGVVHRWTTAGLHRTLVEAIGEDGTLSQVGAMVSANGEKYGFAPSWSVGTNDNSDKVLTMKMANSLPSLLHSTGNETVSGAKVFTSSPSITSGWLWFKNSENQNVGGINSSSGNTYMRSYNSTTGERADLNIRCLDDGTKYATAPSPPTNATSNEIATANWVNTKLATKQATMSAGTGIALDGATINHSNSITANTSGIGSTTKVPVIKYDAQGHITSCTTATIYPPTSVGTSGQYWKSDGSGTGAWQTLASAPASGSAVAISAGAVYTALADKVDLASAITGLSVSGKVITYTKGDGSTGTITTQDTNTDAKVKQTNSTGASAYPILLKNGTGTGEVTNGVLFDDGVTIQPSTGTLSATILDGKIREDREDITGQTVNLDNLNLSSGNPHIIRYIEKTDGGAAAITNMPVEGKPFILDVELIRWTSTSDYITMQRFISSSAQANEYVRYCTNGTWGTWTKRVFTDANTDTKVRQTLQTGNYNLPLLLSNKTNTDTTANVDNTCYRNNSIYANPSTGTITATKFAGALTGNVTGNCSGSSGSCTGNAATATKATQDSAGQQINTTYIKGLSVSGKVITYTKGDGTTGTITTQDSNTTYSAGTGISISSNKINHSNSVTANTSGVGSATAVPIIKYDAQGHITSCTTATIYPPTTAGTSGQIWVSDGSGAGAWKTPSVSPSNIFSNGTMGNFTRDTWIGPEKQDRFLMIRVPHQNLSLYMKTSVSGGQTKVYQSKDNYNGNGGHTISVLMPKGIYWKVVVDESMASGDNYYWINTSIAWELS